MECEGVLADGSRCTNEFTKDGFCAACTAPKGMALVRCDRPAVEFDEELPLNCKLFLETYMETRRLGASAKVLGVSVNQHKIWLGEVRGKEHLLVPGYPEAFEVALQDVQAQEDDILHDAIEEGLREVTYDGEGNLKQTRYRQSEGLYKMRLQALNPEKYAPDRDKGTGNVTIILNRTNEGGWVNPADKARELDNIPEAVVISDDEDG